MERFMGMYEPNTYKREELLQLSEIMAAKEEGLERGQNERTIDIAKTMLESNETLEKITLYTGLSIEEVNKLKKIK